MSGEELESNIPETERKARDALSSFRAILSQNARILLIGGGFLLALNWSGLINLPLPSWWPVIAVVGIAAGATAYWLSERVEDELPEKQWVKVVALQDEREYWFTPDEFAELTVQGDLYQWDEALYRTYEVSRFNEGTDTLIGNWRGSKPDSHFYGKRTAEDVETDLKSLREDLEPMAMRGREIARRFRALVMRLDERREVATSEILDEKEIDHDLDIPSVSEILEDELPENLHPHIGGMEKDADEAGAGKNGHERGEVEIKQDGYDAILDGDGESPPLGGM